MELNISTYGDTDYSVEAVTLYEHIYLFKTRNVVDCVPGQKYSPCSSFSTNVKCPRSVIGEAVLREVNRCASASLALILCKQWF